MSATEIVMRAPAKVNLYLGVGPRRGDGYHDVATVLQTLEFGDEVRIAPADGLQVISDIDLGIPAEENLAYRAAAAFAAVCGRAPDVRVELVKRVPAGAGLAGGSSDAAAVIAGLAALWGIPATDAHLRATAAAIGTDVPFFLRGGAALYVGRGDDFAARVPVVPMDIVLVSTGDPVPTREAYAAFDRIPHAPAPGPEAVVRACTSGDAAQVASALYNNLTDASVELVSGIAEALAWCRRAEGVMGAAMAGSGSAVFAICESRSVAAAVAATAAEKGWWSQVTRTSDRGVAPHAEEGA